MQPVCTRYMNPESKSAYEELQSYFPKQRAKVMATVVNFVGGLTRQEIADLSGLSINSVCGRVNELINEGALIEQPHPSGVGYWARTLTANAWVWNWMKIC
jgi:hypothetical protein